MDVFDPSQINFAKPSRNVSLKLILCVHFYEPQKKSIGKTPINTLFKSGFSSTVLSPIEVQLKNSQNWKLYSILKAHFRAKTILFPVLGKKFLGSDENKVFEYPK